MAEGEGFEPPLPFRVKRFSRPPVSTTHTSLRKGWPATLLPGYRAAGPLPYFIVRRPHLYSIFVYGESVVLTTKREKSQLAACSASCGSGVTGIASAETNRGKNSKAAATAVSSITSLSLKCCFTAW